MFAAVRFPLVKNRQLANSSLTERIDDGPLEVTRPLEISTSTHYRLHPNSNQLLPLRQPKGWPTRRLPEARRLQL